ncbi:MAG TPA: transposase [Azospirillaceae bacterium]|nr:transposase [Azospirillaceae bacterium]
MDRPAASPLPAAWFRPDAGADVDLGGRAGRIVAIVSLTEALVEDIASGERVRKPVEELRPWQGEAPASPAAAPDLATISPERLAEGRRRLEAMLALDAMKRRSRPVVEEYAGKLGISASHLYALYKDWRGGCGLTGLIPHIRKRRKRLKRLDGTVAAIVEANIDSLFFERGETIKETCRAVAVACRAQGLKPPSPTTVRSRILDRPPEQLALARRGSLVLSEKQRSNDGPGEEPYFPLARVQIDHTVADIFVTDPQHHGAVARPILTLAIDEYSRCVLGFKLRLARPSTLSVALALHHAVFPKTLYCSRMGLSAAWPMYGKPKWLFTDNAAEFDSEGLKVGCEQHDIHHIFRPLDAPHFGGRIERLIGTLMGRLRLIPGATMRNIAERGEEYDPERSAVYTIDEAERRIARMIAEVYHLDRHSTLKVAPRDLWEFGILGDDTVPGRGLPEFPTNPERFLLDLLPVKKRTIQDYGIAVEGLKYNWPVLKGLRRKLAGEQLNVRYNPDDVSRVWVWDPEAFEYYQVPLANGRRDVTPLWEVRRAIAAVEARGYDPDNEALVFKTLEDFRREDDEKAAKVKGARLAIERRREAHKTTVLLPPRLDNPAALPPVATPPALAALPPPAEDAAPAAPRSRPPIDVED